MHASESVVGVGALYERSWSAVERSIKTGMWAGMLDRLVGA